MTPSIFWYDYETTGTDPRRDRPLQVAGLRTDEALNIIGEPVNLYCRPADDILPHPAACLITGIHPRTLLDQGQDEAEFFTRLHAELARPGTCGAGYNSLRFDDEFTRYGLYRNFFDPYAREWQGGNSRWDLIDLVRAAYALRPEGIVWPQQDGRVSLRLELLTQANGIDHGQAHDALSDVTATIGLARLLRERQLLDALASHRPRTLVVETREDQLGGVHFLRRHGFRQVLRHPESWLEVQAFDSTRFPGALEKVQGAGIEICDVPALAAKDPDWKRNMWVLIGLLLRDVPANEPPNPPSFETFSRSLALPAFLPGGCFCALAGDAYVGLGFPGSGAALGVGADPDTAPETAHDRVALWFYVDDVDAAFAAAVRSGARTEREPTDMPWGERVAQVRDPDGNLVNLAAQPG